MSREWLNCKMLGCANPSEKGKQFCSDECRKALRKHLRRFYNRDYYEKKRIKNKTKSNA